MANAHIAWTDGGLNEALACHQRAYDVIYSPGELCSIGFPLLFMDVAIWRAWSPYCCPVADEALYDVFVKNTSRGQSTLRDKYTRALRKLLYLPD